MHVEVLSGSMLTLSERSESLYLEDPHIISPIGRHVDTLKMAPDG